MQYVITFLEGLISFVSPCMLPLLPLYVSYFAGNADKKHHIFFRALGFVLGFTLVFTIMGLFAGTLSRLLMRYQTIINVVCGACVILFGLGYLDVIHLPVFKGVHRRGQEIKSILSAVLFGVIYSVSLTPCVGAFLGSALLLASTSGGAAEGTLLLFVYSMGLGIPFLVSAVLIDQLHTVFGWIKRHYGIINRICGTFLILIGVMMLFGMMNVILRLFA